MNARFYFPDGLSVQEALRLPETVAHHAVRVLRLVDGTPIVLFDGRGGEVRAILSVRGKTCFAINMTYHALERESPLKVVLAQSLASGEKMDWIVQKAVELGAVGVVPLQTERAVLKLSAERAERRREHWQRVAVSACEQCGRNRVPEIGAVSSLQTYLETTAGVERWLLAPEGKTLAQCVRPEGMIHIMIGPEGGWSAAEYEKCIAAGCVAVGLGPRVLRTETAGLAMLAAMQAQWGDW